jgi:putative heme-binding domain-containing protein
MNSSLRSASVNPVSDSRRLAYAAVLATSLVARVVSQAASADDELALGVRTTEPLTPAEQRAKFKLPPGFEIQLVASEPDINKPMNLAFDATGRLWVTTSIEYPWAAPTNRPARDRLMIFEDFGPDGRARKVTQFADGLNIPIGIYPFRSPSSVAADVRRRTAEAGGASASSPRRLPEETWKALVWSIPYIWLLEDTDGDNQADKRTPLYGPFDVSRDTHGNQASFRRGFDGWLYATHGFNNDSHVTARDGSHVDLNSGNTYRIRLDGSRIEHHTHGQVNPFGLAWDARGNLYSSDCHSAPIYQLLAGGWYPSFGKPHDGLGYAPVMLEHAHGSTAIDGAFYYNDDLWPAEYQDTFMIGNVMTSRLNRDKITFIGSTPKATEQPDFLTTTDPWFRPVDNILGPDGALYIADFYNRIIGHYEVPLTHPGRDRERGRLWRVVYKGEDGKAALRNPALHQQLDGLIAELGSPNLTRRLLAMAEIQDRFASKAARELSLTPMWLASTVFAAWTSDPARAERSSLALRYVHTLWLNHRLGHLEPSELEVALRAPLPLIRLHALRVLSEVGLSGTGFQPVSGASSPSIGRGLEARQTGKMPVPLGQAALAALSDPDALVRRCAAEALGNWPAFDHLRPLLTALAKADPADTHLVYVLRKSLRDHLKVPAIFEQVLAKQDWSEPDQRAFADVSLAVPTPPAASFLLARLGSLSDATSPTLGDALKHAARYAPEADLPKLADFIRAKFADQTDFQLALFRSVDQGLRQRGLALPASLKSWGGELVGKLLGSGATSAWNNAPLEAATENPWDFQERKRTDGRTIRVLSSLLRGEQKTGVLRSPEFAAGAKVTFWLCGHDGYPDKPAKKVNAARLRDATTGAVLFEAWPPRNDTATQITWDTAPHAGKRVVLEVTDADTGDAYAWLALGDLEGAPALPSASPRALADRTAGAAELAARLGLKEAAPKLRELAAKPGDSELRTAAARGLAGVDPVAAEATLAAVVADGAQPLPVRERFGVLLAELNTAASRAAVVAALKGVPYRVQQAWAVALTATRDGAEAFLQAVEQGFAAPRILQLTGARSRLERANPANWQARVEKLTRELAPPDEAREKLLAARRNAYALADAKAAEGQRIFEVNCGVCHQLDGKGGLVGPQLTGIGNRGVERLCEDILDPNRNVDHAFATTTLTLKDGEAVSGLFRREEGELLVLANATGQEFTVPKKDVKERAASQLSLMPDNFGEVLSEPDFNHLLAFLLGKR